MYKFIVLPALVTVLFGCQSQEEQTSESSKTTNKKKVTIEEVEQGIRSNIVARTEAGGGYFNFQKDSVDLHLKLVRVHTEYLSVLGPDQYFACVDLATENGDVYDMDFFLTGTPGEMRVTRTDLHKLNGKPYYTWKRNKQDKTWYTVPVKEASNDLLGVIEGKDQFNFTYEVTLPEISGEAQVWLPIAQSDDFQTIELLSQEAPGIQEVIQDPEYGNSIWYLKLTPEHSKQKITLRYRVERKEKTAYSEQSLNLQKYLEASSLMPVGDRFSTIASQVIRERQADTPLTKARALYDYIIDNMRYAKEGIYGTGDANYACDSKSGNCTEFHSFFISLARSAGIPARFAVGAAIPSERNEGGVDGYHCWAEFYAEDKWWPVDISEGNKYTALATYYFGHHPANRIEFSRGRDLDPEPLPASGPINFLAYPVMEIDGKPAYPETSFTFSRGTTGS
jgi:transglutaminase-like putative cysteine protease